VLCKSKRQPGGAKACKTAGIKKQVGLFLCVVGVYKSPENYEKKKQEMDYKEKKKRRQGGVQGEQNEVGGHGEGKKKGDAD